MIEEQRLEELRANALDVEKLEREQAMDSALVQGRLQQRQVRGQELDPNRPAKDVLLHPAGPAVLATRATGSDLASPVLDQHQQKVLDVQVRKQSQQHQLQAERDRLDAEEQLQKRINAQ